MTEYNFDLANINQVEDEYSRETLMRMNEYLANVIVALSARVDALEEIHDIQNT